MPRNGKYCLLFNIRDIIYIKYSIPIEHPRPAEASSRSFILVNSSSTIIIHPILDSGGDGGRGVDPRVVYVTRQWNRKSYKKTSPFFPHFSLITHTVYHSQGQGSFPKTTAIVINYRRHFVFSPFILSFFFTPFLNAFSLLLCRPSPIFRHLQAKAITWDTLWPRRSRS